MKKWHNFKVKVSENHFLCALFEFCALKSNQMHLNISFYHFFHDPVIHSSVVMSSSVRQFISRHPIVKGMIAYGVMWPTGNIIQQTIDGKTWRKKIWQIKITWNDWKLSIFTKQKHMIGLNVHGFQFTVRWLLHQCCLVGFDWRQLYFLGKILAQPWRKPWLNKLLMDQRQQHCFTSSSVWWRRNRLKRAKMKFEENCGRRWKWLSHNIFPSSFPIEAKHIHSFIVVLGRCVLLALCTNNQLSFHCRAQSSHICQFVWIGMDNIFSIHETARNTNIAQNKTSRGWLN